MDLKAMLKGKNNYNIIIVQYCCCVHAPDPQILMSSNRSCHVEYIVKLCQLKTLIVSILLKKL